MIAPTPLARSDAPPAPTPEALALLDECFEQFRFRLIEIARSSLEMSGDLFEGHTGVSEQDVDAFRAGRRAWLETFDRTLRELYERRRSGVRRKGRRPDFDASLASLRVLSAYDQEKQAALSAAASFLGRLTRRELAALDLRVEQLLPDGTPRDFDNPFSPDYVLDAIGVSSRKVYPNPRVWRPCMERLVADLTPAANKIYITLNRLLADRNVLPAIKAALRARSEHRPEDDKELIGTFGKLFGETPPVIDVEVEVPANLSEPGRAASFDFSRDDAPAAAVQTGAAPAAPRAAPATAAPAVAASSATVAGGVASLPLPAGEVVRVLVPTAVLPPEDAASAGGDTVMAPRAILAGLVALAQLGAQAHGGRAGGDGDFPDLDPLMALGTSTTLFNTLAQWQRADLPGEIVKSSPGAPRGAVVPLNLIPHMRAAIADQVSNPTDRITIDVIALLFDYIFRDPSIDPAQRRLFARLQVPVLKAALLDRAFFSDGRHPARLLLDHLAEAAIGAGGDGAYRDAFEREAADVVEGVCRDFGIDVSVFERADERIARFLDGQRKRDEEAVAPDVATALAEEQHDVDRSQVRVLVRDKLAGLPLPFEVRSFVETIWSDHLVAVRQSKGDGSTDWTAATRTLDDLLWSITAKERTGQKARLTKMIPGLILGLRKGAAAVGVAPERAKAFFDALYVLHTQAIRPRGTEPAASAAAAPATDAGVVPADAQGPRSVQGPQRIAAADVHDFVSEMVVGTWLAFRQPNGGTLSARLAWVSPLRTKYVFTSRARTRALMFTPEELAWKLGAGEAQLVVEPVPLFDRAVSAALDTLAAQQPKKPAPEPTPRAA